ELVGAHHVAGVARQVERAEQRVVQPPVHHPGRGPVDGAAVEGDEGAQRRGDLVGDDGEPHHEGGDLPHGGLVQGTGAHATALSRWWSRWRSERASPYPPRTSWRTPACCR